MYNYSNQSYDATLLCYRQYKARKRVVLRLSIMSGFLVCIFSTFISKHEKDHSAHKNHESDMKNECLPATNKRVDK